MLLEIPWEYRLTSSVNTSPWMKLLVKPDTVDTCKVTSWRILHRAERAQQTKATKSSTAAAAPTFLDEHKVNEASHQLERASKSSAAPKIPLASTNAPPAY